MFRNKAAFFALGYCSSIGADLVITATQSKNTLRSNENYPSPYNAFDDGLETSLSAAIAEVKSEAYQKHTENLTRFVDAAPKTKEHSIPRMKP